MDRIDILRERLGQSSGLRPRTPTKPAYSKPKRRPPRVGRPTLPSVKRG